MENSEDKDNEDTQQTVLPINNLSDSDLSLNPLEENPYNENNDLRIIGFKVELDDDQVYSFSLDESKSISTGILSVLADTNEIYGQEIIQADQPTTEAGRVEIPSINPVIFSQGHGLSSENINSDSLDEDILPESTGKEAMEFHHTQNETGGVLNIPNVSERFFSAFRDANLGSMENEDRSNNIPALELKIGSNCLENKGFEVHIKAKTDPVGSSSINKQQSSNEDYLEKDQLFDIIKIDADGSHHVKYFKKSPTVRLEGITERAIKEIQTEKETSDSTRIEDSCNNPQNSRAILSKTQKKVTESANPEIDPSLVPQAAIQTGKEYDATTQTGQTENVATSTDFNIYLINEDNYTKSFLDTEDLRFIPQMVARKEIAKTKDNQTEENCHCEQCGHKEQHDCIYKCCYHRDCENIIPTSILLGHNLLQYSTGTYGTFKCDYCQCRLNRSCSETTTDCVEKLKSDIHPRYCCKCGMNPKSLKDASTSMNEIEKLEGPKSIKLKSEIFNSLAWDKKISHLSQLKVPKNLEDCVAVRVSRSPKTEKVRFLDMPIFIEYCLNSLTFSKLGRSNIVTNPIDIKLNEKTVPGSGVEEESKSKVKSVIDESNKAGRKGSLPVSSEAEKKSVRNNNGAIPKMGSYYSHSPICPCITCHSNFETVQKKENRVPLNSSGGVLGMENNDASETQKRSISPKIKPENFDYSSKDGWKSYSCKTDEFLNKKIEATDIIHRERTSGESFHERDIQGFNDACEMVNDHLLSLRPVNENKIRKASEILHKRWFEVVGSKYSDVHEVKNYIQYFKEFSNNLVKTLLHSVDNNGNNVLHFAFANNRFDLVDELMKEGFALDLLSKENKSGNTPLMICAISQPKSHSDWTVVRKCFEFSDVNEKSKNGQTPLMNAASCGFRVMLDLLLDVGANPNLQDKDGSTALMYAAEHGHEKCIKSLVRHKKCDPTIRDKDGDTACSIALSNGHKNIAVLIHMQALEKRRLSRNTYSTQRFIWTNSNKTARKKTLAMVPPLAISDLS